MDGRIQSLCRHAKKGNKVAACELLSMYYADIFAYLRRLCRNNQDAEDLTQEAFVKVWASLDSFKGRSRFSTWLHSIAHNTYIDWRRNNNGDQCRLDRWWHQDTDKNSDPFASAVEKQIAERLYKIVDQLDEGKKHVVHLHYYQGLSLRETARVLNVSTSTVKYRLREVMKVLRAKISVEED